MKKLDLKIFTAVAVASLLGGAAQANLLEKAQSRAEKSAGILVKMAQDTAAAASESNVSGIKKIEKYDALVPAGILMYKSKCIVVIPGEKTIGYSFFGMRYGAGIATCKVSDDSNWSDPVFVKLIGAKYGPEIGFEQTDLLLIFTNDSAPDTLSRPSLKLGADISVAAGPIGREVDAETNLHIQDGILSYSHSKGVYAGISLNGGELVPDKKANKKVYGNDVDVSKLLTTPADPNSSSPVVAKFVKTLTGLQDLVDAASGSGDDGDSN